MSLGMVFMLSACSFVRRATPLAFEPSSMARLRTHRHLRHLRLAAESASRAALPKGSVYWQEKLAELSKPAAVQLVPELSPVNVLGYVNKNSTRKASLVDFAVGEKEKHPDKLLLIRVGDFYEAFGLDALMLVQHAGLNPMGKKCRAGCPVVNVQSTLDCLTAAGLTVAVYEEVGSPMQGQKLKPRELKRRELMQVVTRASPTYLYERLLSPEHIAYEEPPPYAAVSVSASGYTFVQARQREIEGGYKER